MPDRVIDAPNTKDDMVCELEMAQAYINDLQSQVARLEAEKQDARTELDRLTFILRSVQRDIRHQLDMGCIEVPSELDSTMGLLESGS